MRTRPAIAAGVLALSTTGLTACSGGTDLSAVAVTCMKTVDRAMASVGDEYSSSDFLELVDGSLEVSSPVRGQLGTAITGIAVGCIMKETEAPASVEAQLRKGTERDGRNEVSWNDLTMSYRFLPEKGLRAVVKVT